MATDVLINVECVELLGKFRLDYEEFFFFYCHVLCYLYIIHIELCIILFVFDTYRVVYCVIYM